MKQPATGRPESSVDFDRIISILSRAESEISKEVQSDEAADSQAFEEKAWRMAAAKLREEELLRFLHLKNTDFSDGIEFRRSLTFILLRITKIWLIFIAFIIVLQGLYGSYFFWPWKYVFAFHLESSVIIALLSTTTVTVLGLFLAVTRHIFYRNNTDQGSGDGKNKGS